MSVTTIEETFRTLLNAQGIFITQIDQLPKAGSNRSYFRIHSSNQTYIGTHSDNISENETFLYFADHFKTLHVVPTVIAVSPNRQTYIQEDLGTTSLLHVLQQEGYTSSVYALYQKSLQKLALMQVKGHEHLNYTQCFSTRKFDYQTMIADLYYFKFCFIDPLNIPYDKQKLADDFDAFIHYLTQTEHQYFMFRDFQSRNIQIQHNEPFFIDFQGGMQGAMHYDVASLLWQARANLPEEWRESLLEDYIGYANEQLSTPLHTDTFKAKYNGYVLIRLLQVLGAYGFRGLFEKKQAFIQSILPALENLAWFIEHKKTGVALPELFHLLQKIITPEIKNIFMVKKATEDTLLKIKVGSFSYKKGIPEDPSGNGGGYVFDCRGILNPGRIDQYKMQTGRDIGVIDYLESNTRMPEFIENVFNVVDITIEDYMERGFENLQIMFGCTGGQHRSVYSADAMAKHIEDKYGLEVDVLHREQEAKNWINEMY